MRVAFRAFGLVAGLSLAGGGLDLAAQAQEATGLNVGDLVPAFEAPTDEGGVWRSSDHVGEKLLVVYFYPAAMTDGCTAQACAFRDNRTQLQELGAEVVGISGDRIETLKQFRGSNRINFPLLSDSTGAVARVFGVPTRAGGTMRRVIDGREVELTRDVTTARWTFIIGRDGRILYRDTQVNAEGDGEAVVRAIRRLASS